MIKQEEKIKEKFDGKEEREERIVRILDSDIGGDKGVYAGLTKIKGVSWSFANAVCKKLGIDKRKKISSLTEKEIESISKFILSPDLPAFLVNRKKDRDTGKDMQLIGADLSLRKEFDIKRLKKIRAYKGIRHMLGQPVRGQRTKSHFRKNRALGVTKKAKTGKKG